jgi:hypothetical protein
VFSADPATLLTGIDPFSVYGTGSAITGKPAEIVGYCKYAPSASDTGEIIAALIDSARNPVATAHSIRFTPPPPASLASRLTSLLSV